jgi:hypothetical protein
MPTPDLIEQLLFDFLELMDADGDGGEAWSMAIEFKMGVLR